MHAGRIVDATVKAIAPRTPWCGSGMAASVKRTSTPRLRTPQLELPILIEDPDIPNSRRIAGICQFAPTLNHLRAGSWGDRKKLADSKGNEWSRGRELNSRPADYESAALPLSYLGPEERTKLWPCHSINFICLAFFSQLEYAPAFRHRGPGRPLSQSAALLIVSPQPSAPAPQTPPQNPLSRAPWRVRQSETH